MNFCVWLNRARSLGAWRWRTARCLKCGPNPASERRASAGDCGIAAVTGLRWAIGWRSKAGARIVRVLPRQTAFSRKEAGAVTRAQVIAANIDVLFVVAGLDGDFNLRRLERYLLLARESGARPVVVLNKSDLRADAEEVALHAAALGAPVVTTSALDGCGLGALEAHIAPCQTAALTGSSGVGKSTLLNRLLGSERQRVQEVRESDSRGRHTTVRRELFLAPNGWLIVDTPGLRELQLWAGAESVDLAFADIAELANSAGFATAGIRASRDARWRREESMKNGLRATPSCSARRRTWNGSRTRERR